MVGRDFFEKIFFERCTPNRYPPLLTNEKNGKLWDTHLTEIQQEKGSFPLKNGLKVIQVFITKICAIIIVGKTFI